MGNGVVVGLDRGLALELEGGHGPELLGAGREAASGVILSPRPAKNQAPPIRIRDSISISIPVSIEVFRRDSRPSGPLPIAGRTAVPNAPSKLYRRFVGPGRSRPGSRTPP